MRLSLRFILPLVAILGVAAYFAVPFVERMTIRWFERDLDMRSGLVASAMEDRVVNLLRKHHTKELAALFEKVIQDERLYAVALCGSGFKPIVATPTFPAILSCEIAARGGTYESPLQGQSLHIYARELALASGQNLRLVLLHDMAFVKRRSAESRRYLTAFLLGLLAVTSIIMVAAAQLVQWQWISGIRNLIRGEGLWRPLSELKRADLVPVAKELKRLVRELETERRVRDERATDWNPQSLKKLLKRDLSGDEILIVSNREPYIHVRRGEKIEVQLPASGLVTALEPIMRACSGTWVAHGGGSADRETVDARDHVRVPPEQPTYDIRRVWLSEEEERGYYYGFANEGLWPLCHIAHTRPIFRTEDWKQYVAVNRKFAGVVLEEAKTSDPVILVQDYHFALLPRMIRDRLPRATIITFWHIPWPNSEAFGICPWKEEILTGLLGSSILGFHTRYHCNNFIDTIDRFLEARLDRDQMTVSFQGDLTAIHDYPISIEWPSRWLKGQPSVVDARQSVREKHGLPPDTFVGVGVDRLDYTKGILERFLSVERFLDLYPDFVGKFSFIQIAAPSRTSIEQYRNFDRDLRALADRINEKFKTAPVPPIILLVEHHEPQDIFRYYRAADLCSVTSLHDGMNLVAKEFVAARDDEGGVLILSQFTGAARELPEAIVVNPYNIDQCAEGLHVALTMSQAEKKDRMRSMRGLVQEFNVYRWAGRMLVDAARMRERNRLLARTLRTRSLMEAEHAP